MRRGGVFWGGILILLGVLFLLQNAGVINTSVWGLFWPLLLVGLGVWLLLGVLARPAGGAEEASVPLAGAGRAELRIAHGGGRLYLSGGAASGELFGGHFAGGLDHRVERRGELVTADLRPARRAFVFPGPWMWRGPLDWSVRLSGEVPMSLHLDLGADDVTLDLSSLRLTDLVLHTGAGATDATLPAAAGYTKARVEAGMASVTLRVPDGVAARIQVDGGLAGIDVDSRRFPRIAGGYQSEGYEAAANKVDISAQVGLGALRVV